MKMYQIIMFAAFFTACATSEKNRIPQQVIDIESAKSSLFTIPKKKNGHCLEAEHVAAFTDDLNSNRGYWRTLPLDSTSPRFNISGINSGDSIPDTLNYTPGVHKNFGKEEFEIFKVKTVRLEYAGFSTSGEVIKVCPKLNRTQFGLIAKPLENSPTPVSVRPIITGWINGNISNSYLADESFSKTVKKDDIAIKSEKDFIMDENLLRWISERRFVEYKGL